MNDATPLTLLAHERNSIFKYKQHTCTLHDPLEPEKYNYTMMLYGIKSHYNNMGHIRSVQFNLLYCNTSTIINHYAFTRSLYC